MEYNQADIIYTLGTEAKTKTVERLIAPLIHLVTSLHSTYYQPGQIKRSGNEVLACLQQSLDHFVNVGMSILQQHPVAVGKILEQLNSALGDVQNIGAKLIKVGSEFVVNAGNQTLRTKTMEMGRATLMAVAKLLIIADMIDAHLILRQAEKVKEMLNGTDNVDSTKELLESCTNFNAELQVLTEMTRKRLRDLRYPSEQDDLQSAIAMLKITTPIMVASSKAFVRHPELDAARRNREFAMDEMRSALDCFCHVIQGQSAQEEVALSSHGQINDLVQNLEEFQRRVHMDPCAFRPQKHRKELEELLERIASGSGVIADLCNTRDERKKQIVNGVNHLRQALQDLLKQYEENMGRTEASEELDLSTVYLMNTVKDLRRFLRRAVIDHVSDAFLDTKTPLMVLIDAARQGDLTRTEEAARIFEAHAEKIVDVARLVCDMSNDEDGVRVLRYAAQLCEKLTPQVINAAFLLCEKPESTVVQENMQVFENVWLERLKVLTMAMDSLISAYDFLPVSEIHIREDVKDGIKAIVEKNTDAFDRSAGSIRGRTMRICEVVTNEIDMLQAGQYTENVKNATRRLKENALPQFVSRAEKIVAGIEADEWDGDPTQRPEIDELIDACDVMVEAIADVRQALLLNRHSDDVDSDNEYEEDVGSGTANGVDARSQMSDTDADNQQRIMRHLPEESKREIQKQIDVFRVTQRKFEYEVGKWDDTGNDIISLAKHMCMIMTHMTDFTKGRGPYRTTMDVIKAAQEISEDGARLNALSRQIGNECVESDTKKDLFAYLERITLFCHQLNVTSKVKADVQVVGDELRVSGLEAATSLIQNAKNLLNAVILTVKAAFIASTKYRRKENSARPQLVEWRMAQKQQLQPSLPQGNQLSMNGHGGGGRSANGVGIIRRVSERKPKMASHNQFYQ